MRIFYRFSIKNVYFSQTDGKTGKKISASELRIRIIQCAKSLQSKYGIKDGDVIGLFTENRLEFPVVLLAAFCLGATVAPLNVTYTTRELEHSLTLSRPKVIFVSHLVHRRTLEILPRSRFVQHVVCFDAVEPNKHIISYDQLVENTPVREDKFIQRHLVIFILIYHGWLHISGG